MSSLGSGSAVTCAHNDADPALSLCRAPGQGQLQAARPCPPSCVTGVGDIGCPMNCKEWSVASSETSTFRARCLFTASTGGDRCEGLNSPLGWLGLSREVGEFSLNSTCHCEPQERSSQA